MSDCHSSFGAARSNRRGGCSRSSTAGRGSSSPSSCRIRRTVVSLTPSASNRRSTSAIRRVPNVGLSCFAVLTAARAAAGVLVRSGGVFGSGISASSPPSRYRLTHSETVVVPSPKTRATSTAGVPPSTTSRTTRIRRSTGCGRRLVPEPPAPNRCLVLPFLGIRPLLSADRVGPSRGRC
jgi:hypothetical protein